jgi:hypothetical protein
VRRASMNGVGAAAVSNWACGRGRCSWAPTLRAANVTMALLFDYPKNAHHDERFHEGMLDDTYLLLQWALARPCAPLVSSLSFSPSLPLVTANLPHAFHAQVSRLLAHPPLDAVATVDVTAAFSRAAAQHSRAVMAALAPHPALAVHHVAAASDRTALELSFDPGEA